MRRVGYCRQLPIHLPRWATSCRLSVISRIRTTSFAPRMAGAEWSSRALTVVQLDTDHARNVNSVERTRRQKRASGMDALFCQVDSRRRCRWLRFVLAREPIEMRGLFWRGIRSNFESPGLGRIGRGSEAKSEPVECFGVVHLIGRLQ